VNLAGIVKDNVDGAVSQASDAGKGSVSELAKRAIAATDAASIDDARTGPGSNGLPDKVVKLVRIVGREIGYAVALPRSVYALARSTAQLCDVASKLLAASGSVSDRLDPNPKPSPKT
jgi:hypothetical protein